MKLAQFEIMNGIINDLDADDTNQMADYLNDCVTVGDWKTTRYLRQELAHARRPDLAWIRIYLAEDCAGV